MSFTEIDILKKQAAIHAVNYIQSGMIVGLGSGSTVFFIFEEIGNLIKSGTLEDIICIPSSNQTEKLAKGFDIPLISFDNFQKIDINIDGADEVDPKLNMIKGRGGALLKEKILAQVSKQNIIIVDESKLTENLGARHSLPVEVIPFSWKLESKFLKEIGANVILRKNEDGKIYVTDQNNFILDCDFGIISEPGKLSDILNQRAGILEHGLFINLASEVVVSGKDGIKILKSEH